MDDLNSLPTFPSVALQRGHFSLRETGAGAYTVSRQDGQFRYAMRRAGYPPLTDASTYG
jgi:hypothetical protein